MRARELDEASRLEQAGAEQLRDGLVGLSYGGAGLDRAGLLGDSGVVQQLRQAARGAPPHRQRVTRVRPGVRRRREVVGGRLVAQVEDHLAPGGPAAPATVRVSRRHRER